MTLPTFVGVGTGSESGPTWPAGHAVDDYALLGCENHTLGTTLDTPSGWTPVCRVPHPITSSVLTVFGRFATSTSEGAPSLSADADHRWGRIVVYRGVNKANPVHSITTATMVNASTANCPGVATDLDDCMIVWVMAYAFDNAGPVISAQAQSQCGSVTERADDGTVTGSGGGVAITDGTLAAKGEIGPMNCSWSGTSGECATIALQAADKTFATNTLVNNIGSNMAIPVLQSTAQSVCVWMADASDGKTGKTGLTLAVTLKKQGETSFSSISPTVTEIGNGHYDNALTPTHMNTVGIACLRETATGADPADCPNIIDVVAYDKTSATRGTAGTALPAAAAEAAGGLYTRGTGAGQIRQVANGMIDANSVRLLDSAWETPTTAGRPNVNAKSWNDLTTVALPLVPTTAGRTLDVAPTGEAGLDFDNVKDASAPHTLTNIRVPNVTLVDTLTTYTGNTPQTGDNFARLGAPAGASIAADIAADKAVDDAIKTKTDQLTFTIANQVDANALTGGGGGGGGSTGYGEQRIEQDSTSPIHFTLLDDAGARVTGAAAAINATISINGAAASAAAGTFAEIDAGDQPGEYYYTPDAAETADIGTVVLYLTPDAAEFEAQSVLVRITGPQTVDNEAIADEVWGTLLEGSATAADLIRLITGVLAGKVTNFTTGTFAFKSLDGTKTRLTVTVDETGRLTITVGNLT